MHHLYESKYNIIEKLETPIMDYQYIIVNSFSGSIDAINKDVMGKFKALKLDGSALVDRQYRKFFIDRGYFYRENDEENKKIFSVKQASENLGKSKNSARIVILTSYQCNLNCSYCYQKSVDRNKSPITISKIKKVFSYIDELMKKNNCHITLDVMGGEPLLDGETNKNIIRSIIIECEKRNLTFRLISNGVNLIKYIDILSSTKALEFIQITIDGIPSVQIARRISHNQNYIPNLIAGIKAALDSGIRITARTNIDCDNIAKLIDLYKWYNDFGWLKNVNFFPYLSPVHDNTCVACGKNFDEFRILSKLLMYENKYPDIIGIFNKSNFLAYQYLKNPLLTNMFTFPRYYRCEANVNQLVFDPTGLLYACIEAAGHEQYAVGDYSTKLILNEVKLNRWRKYRNVTTLDRCLACKICFICGGNCTWLAFYTELGTDTSRCKMLEKSVGFLLRKRGHILVNNSVV